MPARQGLFMRKGSTVGRGSQPSPMSDGGKDSAPGETKDAPVRTSNTGSDGPGDQGSADDGQGAEIVQCPNCGCSFDAEDPTNPDSYTPPDQAPDGSQSPMGGSDSSGMASTISSMLGGSGGGDMNGGAGSPGQSSGGY